MLTPVVGCDLDEAVQFSQLVLLCCVVTALAITYMVVGNVKAV